MNNQHIAAENKKLIREFYKSVLIGGNIDDADRFLRSDYIQHNPKVGQGLSGFKTYFKKLHKRMNRMGVKQNNEIILVIAENDYVVVYGTNKITGKVNSSFSYTDIFRVQDGYLAEHWDVIQGKTFFDNLVFALGG